MFSKTCGEVTAKLPPAFIEERRYLKNVTAKTLAWYEQSFRAFDGALADEAAIKRRVVELRQRGISPTSINTWLRCINAYLVWTGAGFKVSKLQEEKKLL